MFVVNPATNLSGKSRRDYRKKLKQIPLPKREQNPQQTNKVAAEETDVYLEVGRRSWLQREVEEMRFVMVVLVL